MATINGKGQVLPGNVFIYPLGEKLTTADLQAFIQYKQVLAIKKTCACM